LKSKFHFFSSKRLDNIKNEVDLKILKNIPSFYFGNTPWVRSIPKDKYYTYMDASFPTYMDVFSNKPLFLKKDLIRITKEEEKWLQNASHIFWGSEWTKNEALKKYKLDENKMSTVYVGGNISIPTNDHYKGELLFTFISLNFEKKGGWLCVNAFKKINNLYPLSKLIILGEKPPSEVLEINGIEYAGYLRKTVPEERSKFISIISRSFLMIHPTEMDCIPTVICESGYFGCPTIAPNRFGIPELIKNDITGIVIKTPFNEDDIANPIIELIKNNERYLQMRKDVREFSLKSLSWNAVCKKMSDVIISENLVSQ